MSKYERAKHEFLLDQAIYFIDKPDLYLSIKNKMALALGQPGSAIRICGSAYWGKKYRDETPFEPGVSDLDIAIVSPLLFSQCMTEIREICAGFTDLTPFPVKGSENTYETFRQYAVKKGMLRADFLPNVPTMQKLKRIAHHVSGDYLEHFSRITTCIYDSDDAFALKQTFALEKIGGS
ncbi:hypothetical protein D1820_05510 [Phaeobacter sp. LSS9]|uniref:hypothetical protein n=1 Tax=unclassified Phaeobacter TaxID=2621772 RepID=UPI000E49DBC4|nr:hypothetical protein [Phaeobacter sp. LSS9]AXT34478.1 hypothetical protein D1820_05510 [Phaeobacter sp. LSS9]